MPAFSATPCRPRLGSGGHPLGNAVESDSIRTVEASVSADLAVHACIEGTEPPYVERVTHGGALLLRLPEIKINLYLLGV